MILDRNQLNLKFSNCKAQWLSFWTFIKFVWLLRVRLTIKNDSDNRTYNRKSCYVNFAWRHIQNRPLIQIPCSSQPVPAFGWSCRWCRSPGQGRGRGARRCRRWRCTASCSRGCRRPPCFRLRPRSRLRPQLQRGKLVHLQLTQVYFNLEKYSTSHRGLEITIIISVCVSTFFIRSTLPLL